MAEIIRMPRMSDTMEEGVIAQWEKGVGDKVEPGDVLAIVETDKAEMEFESVYEGVLLHIEVEEGAVPIDGVIAVIGEEGEDFKQQLEEARQSSNGQEAPEEEQETKKEETEKEAGETASTQEGKAKQPEGGDGGSSPGESRIKASPLARSMAEDAGIDLAQVEGTGDNGRIIKRDIEQYKESQPAKPEEAPAAEEPAKEARPAIPAFTFSGDEEAYEEVRVSQMRKTIARRLAESKFSAPHFYLTMEIDMEKAIQWRKQINEVAPEKISFNDIIVKAVAAALRLHPAVNTSWHEDSMRRHKNIHIGVAVAVEEGLLVPVIRFADMKTLSQINAEVRELAERARRKKLAPEEMQGNTFTISNLGMFGIEEFTAIINPPDSCILAVGGIIEKPVVKDGEIVPGSRMKVTLSCDHRAVDGATGSQFLQTFKGILEDPIRLLV